MNQLRAFIRERTWLALGLVMATLVMKALVPGGYMLASQGKVITVQLCDDTGGGHLTEQMVIPLKPGTGQGTADHSKSACPYSSLTYASLGGTDPLLLAIALAFIVALGFLPLPPRLLALGTHLRPPLRGPPLLA
ncbi:MAG: DUF2946 family protein [Novosphingobium sp.]